MLDTVFSMADGESQANRDGSKSIQISMDAYRRLESWKGKTHVPIKILMERFIAWLDAQYEFKRGVVLGQTPTELGEYRAHILLEQIAKGTHGDLPKDDPRHPSTLSPPVAAPTSEELADDVQKKLGKNTASSPNSQSKPGHQGKRA